MKANGRYAQNEFAGAKILSWAQNLTWYEEAHHRGFDEVVLLNERGEVSECTSANIFAATGREVATPPLSAGCLPGVSRELLLDEIHVPGISVLEKKLFPRDLEQADQVFITSTTRDLMPVSYIEGLEIKSEGLATVDELAQAFADYRNSYVTRNANVTPDRITV
jgi:branched-chain amino acid aminotransferase